MTNKKFTLRDYYNALLEIEEVASNPVLREMTEKRLVQLDKKNSSASTDRKPTEKQIANEGIKSAILEHLAVATDENPGITVGELIKECPACEGLSSSKVTALVTQLVKAEKAVRKEIKGRAYFSLVE